METLARSACAVQADLARPLCARPSKAAVACPVPALSSASRTLSGTALQAPRPQRRLSLSHTTCLASAPARAAAAAALQQGEDLAEYIANSFVSTKMGWTKADITAELPLWKKLGERLAKQLKLDADKLNDAQRSRIYQYYLPTYFWVKKQLDAHRAKYAGSGQEPPALVVGISAPQGCGKTTIVSHLQELLVAEGCPTASVSLDDYYLTGAEQDALAARHPDNGLLRFRGNAGSHDLSLAKANLVELKNCNVAGKKVQVPRYDKSLREGRGDRAPKETWPVLNGPLQVVLFEGWMLGFKPVGEAAAAAVDKQLVPVDGFLQQYADSMESMADSWIVIKVGDPQWVFNWRLQAEVEMRATGKAGLTDAQVADFVSRFMPAYKAYLPALYKQGPTGKAGAPRLTLEVDSTRKLVAAE